MSLPPPTAPSVLLKTKEAYTLWFKIFNDFPKVQRPTLGRKIENYFLDLLELIFVCLYLPTHQKSVKLLEGISKIDNLKFLLQLSWENKCMTEERYLRLSEKIHEIGRMLGGWKKGLEKKTPVIYTQEKH